VAVTLVEPHTIERSEGKAKRVLDQRALSQVAQVWVGFVDK
jgi:phenylacetate-coenzyme A ligase PaaK-like adenylate-forming protein